MKKLFITISCLLMLLLVTGCNDDKPNDNEQITKTNTITLTLPDEEEGFDWDVFLLDEEGTPLELVDAKSDGTNYVVKYKTISKGITAITCSYDKIVDEEIENMYNLDFEINVNDELKPNTSSSGMLKDDVIIKPVIASE